MDKIKLKLDKSACGVMIGFITSASLDVFVDAPTCRAISSILKGVCSKLAKGALNNGLKSLNTHESWALLCALRSIEIRSEDHPYETNLLNTTISIIHKSLN